MEQDDKNEPCEPLKLASQLSQARNELHNIRKALHTAQAKHKGDVERLEDLLESAKSLQLNSFKHKEKADVSKSPSKNVNSDKLTEANMYHMELIGVIKSLHRQKNGTPRQGIVSSLSRATLTIEKDIYNNPSHSLEGLEEYSHVWLLYIFHQNTSRGSHAKVSPPRLDGTKLGVFSTRSPHRPNPIGLTLAKLEGIEGNSLLLSGVDIIDGTPVIDIKPYIPYYDSPLVINNNKVDVDKKSEDHPPHITTLPQEKTLQKEESDHGSLNDALISSNNYQETKGINNFPPPLDEEINSVENEKEVNNVSTKESCDHNLESTYSVQPSSEVVSIPQWIKSPPTSGLRVIFNPIAEEQIRQFSCDAEDSNYRLEYLKSDKELKSAIASVLSEDPRSTYRRQKCPDRLYFFMVDSAHITTCFFGEVVEVLRVCPPDKESPCYKFI